MYEITPYAQIKGEKSDEKEQDTKRCHHQKILACSHSTLHGLLHQRKSKKKKTLGYKCVWYILYDKKRTKM